LRGYQQDGVVQSIRAAGGEIFAVTSEPQTLARAAEEDWKTGFEHVGDPHHEILGQCKDRGWLSLFRNDFGDDFKPETGDWISHPKGYFQPGVLALSRDERVLYRWRSRPTRRNAGGAVMRPTALHVWSQLSAAREAPSETRDVAHDDEPVSDGAVAPWPIFVSLLLANGWFLRPVPFDYQVNGSPLRDRLRRAGIRLLVFIAAWIVAFAALPTWIPSLTLIAWGGMILPGVRVVHNRFQNVASDEEPT
jgi:hypothetical protein